MGDHSRYPSQPSLLLVVIKGREDATPRSILQWLLNIKYFMV